MEIKMSMRLTSVMEKMIQKKKKVDVFKIACGLYLFHPIMRVLYNIYNNKLKDYYLNLLSESGLFATKYNNNRAKDFHVLQNGTLNFITNTESRTI